MKGLPHKYEGLSLEPQSPPNNKHIVVVPSVAL